MVKRSLHPIKPGAGTQPSVVVIYEDESARDYAAQFSPQLAGEGGEVAASSEWLSFAGLSDSARAAEAAGRTAAAELVVFAFLPAGDLPGHVKLWMESWISKRSDREGAIVGLALRQLNPAGLACLKEVYLRHAAHRGGMDYLSQIPSKTVKMMPDSLDSFDKRASQITSVLNDILKRGPVPSVPKF